MGLRVNRTEPTSNPRCSLQVHKLLLLPTQVDVLHIVKHLHDFLLDDENLSNTYIAPTQTFFVDVQCYPRQFGFLSYVFYA